MVRKILSNQTGQVVVVVLLTTVVALAIGLSVVGRSINEISTSTNSENSTRAFSAAEAGIERALYNTSNVGVAPNSTPAIPGVSFSNQANATVNSAFGLPNSNSNPTLEYPPIGKDSVAQFWLANPDDLSSAYNGHFTLYFGKQGADYSNDSDKPAVEVHVIFKNSSGEYKSVRSFYDSSSNRSNGFSKCTSFNDKVKTNKHDYDSLFYCKVTNISAVFSGYDSIMVRVRPLYSNLAHPIAIEPESGKSFPAQAAEFKSTGTSGNSIRTINVLQTKSNMPFFLDYALFSASNVQKQ